MEADLSFLETVIAYQFRDRGLLERAVTHKSSRFERSGTNPDLFCDNEQLEFLGDAVLGFVVSEELYRVFPDMAEGGLSKRKAHLVSAQHLYEAADLLELGRFLVLGKGEEMSGGRTKRALLANAFEALIAAMYLDGGMDPVRQFLRVHVLGDFLTENADGDPRVNDFKSALQEHAQRLSLPTPRYFIVKEDGPEHSKTFTVEVRVGRDLVSRAEGLSKKAAGQRAAKLVLEQLRALEVSP